MGSESSFARSARSRATPKFRRVVCLEEALASGDDPETINGAVCSARS